MKYMQEFVEHFGKRSVFSIRDCRIFLKQKKISKQYLYFLIHYLLKKKRINRIAKGYYSFSNEPIVIGFAFAPFYYGLQSALSFHNLWEQETNLVIVTPKKIRTGIRTIMNSNVLIRRIDKKMFFGFDLISHYGNWIPVSSIEKTFIDLVYYNEKISPELLKEIKQKSSKKTMQAYLKKIPQKTRKIVKRLLVY